MEGGRSVFLSPKLLNFVQYFVEVTIVLGSTCSHFPKEAELLEVCKCDSLSDLYYN